MRRATVNRRSENGCMSVVCRPRRGGDDGMNKGLTVRQRLEAEMGADPLRRAANEAVSALAHASIAISDLTGRGALAGITGKGQGRNTDGDIQKDLDILADQIILAALGALPIA